MPENQEEKSYWQGHRAGTAKLAETQQELLRKQEECIGLRTVLDDTSAKLREAQQLYAKFSDRCAQLEQQVADKTLGPSGVEQHPWAAFLRARLRLIHEWAKEGIPGKCCGPANEHLICDELNNHDPGQIRLLMMTSVEPAPLGSHARDLEALRKSQERVAELEADRKLAAASVAAGEAEYEGRAADDTCLACNQKPHTEGCEWGTAPVAAPCAGCEQLKAEMEEMRTADPTELAAQILELKRQLKAMQSGDRVCWHCYDVLQNDPDHCEKCPPFNDCDDEDCRFPGCIQENA